MPYKLTYQNPDKYLCIAFCAIKNTSLKGSAEVNDVSCLYLALIY